MAELVGVSRQAVTKWESDQSAPSTENLIRLAEIFSCGINELAGLSEPQPEISKEVSVPTPPPLKQHIKSGMIVAGIYLGWFLLCKFIWADLKDQTILEWLFGTNPWYHDYLFGWILDYYLICSLISILPALFGKVRFSGVTTLAFLISLPLGEYLGGTEFLTGPGYHMGWAIWSGINLCAVFLGIALQRIPRQEITWRCKRFRIWCLSAAASVLGVIFFVLVNVPRHIWS